LGWGGDASGLSSSPRLFWAAWISAKKDMGALPACGGFGWGVGGWGLAAVEDWLLLF